MLKKVITYKSLSFLLLLFCVFSQALSQTNNKKRNILWITCEDMSPHLSCYGEKAIQTPSLDALASEGIRFTNAFTTSGVCAPSRSAIITGMYQTSIGTDNMRNYNPSVKKDPNAILPSYSVVLPPQVKCFPEWFRRNGYYCTNNAKEDYQFEAPVTAWDESNNKAHWRNRKKDQPFFSVFNLMITHESQLWEREKEPLLVNPATVTIPPYYPDEPEVRHAIARNLSNIKRMDEQAGKIIQQLKEDGLYDETIIFFFSDHGDGLPYVKREVSDRGTKIPLIVRFPDGYKKGTTDDQLISGVDLAPTVLSLAGIVIPQYMQGRAFLGKQAVTPYRQYVFSSKDRMDTEVDRVRAVRDKRFQYIKNFMPEKPYYQDIKYRLQIPMMKRMLQMRDSGLLNETQMLWFRKTKPIEELYDVENDPYQFHNLAYKPQYKKQLVQLRTVLDKWMRETGDLHAIPETTLVKKMWNGKDEPPITATPEVLRNNGYVTLKCSTEGASIGYKLSNGKEANNRSNWIVYNGEKIPVKKGEGIVARAQRIGFTASETTIDF